MKKLEQIKRIRAKLKRLYPDIDTDVIDLDALVDSTLTYRENFSNCLQGYRVEISPRQQAMQAACAIAEQNAGQMLMLRTRECEAQEQLASAVASQTPLLQSAFEEPCEIIDALIKSDKVHGMIFLGPPGLGKTTCVQQELSRLGKKLGEDYIVVTGYITPLALYTLMYENSRKLIVFDDIMKMFDDDKNRGFLQAGLWNPTGVRRIDYGSMSSKMTVPPSFEFRGKVIWCMNHFPQSFEALKSRVFYYNLDFSYGEKVRLMYEIAQVSGIGKEIPDFVYNESKLAGEAYELDFRLLFKLDALRSAGCDWQGIGRKLLSLNADIYAVITALRDAGSVKHACALFAEQTGKSRATFYRIKKKLDTSMIEMLPKVSKSHEKPMREEKVAKVESDAGRASPHDSKSQDDLPNAVDEKVMPETTIAHKDIKVGDKFESSMGRKVTVLGIKDADAVVEGGYTVPIAMLKEWKRG